MRQSLPQSPRPVFSYLSNPQCVTNIFTGGVVEGVPIIINVYVNLCTTVIILSSYLQL